MRYILMKVQESYEGRIEVLKETCEIPTYLFILVNFVQFLGNFAIYNNLLK